MEDTSENPPIIPEEETLLIGIPGGHRQLTLAPDSANVLSDYSIIVIDNENIFESIDKAASPGWQYDYFGIMQQRMFELVNFLKKEKLAICILRDYQWHETSSTSRGRLRVSNYEFLGHKWATEMVTITPQKGKVQITKEAESSAFLDLLRKLKQFDISIIGMKWHWGPLLGSMDIRWLAESSEGNCVAFEASRKDSWGKIVFLPSDTLNHLDLLLECARKEFVRLGGGEFKAASWTGNYIFPGYQLTLSEIKAKEEERDRAVKQLEDSFKKLRQVRDVLLNGQDKPLVMAVKHVFNDLNIPLKDGPKGQEDLALRDNDSTTLVCEVKGRGKTAAKKDMIELMSWVDRINKEEGHEPKGLFVINAWCNNDPEERTKPSFPDPIEKLGRANGFCLMTTIQLFNMWCDFKRKELRGGKELLNKIMKTVGVFEGYEDISINRLSEQS